MSKHFSLSEVKKHGNKSSSWIIIHNDVYDLTKFLDEHPGGEDSILEVAGSDGSQAFEDVAHSEDARELMKKYKIGSISPNERNTFTIACSFEPVRKKCNFEGKNQNICLPVEEPQSRSHDAKPWRTFDGKPRPKKNLKPKLCEAEVGSTVGRRVDSIVVPEDSSSDRARPPAGSKLKWVLLALAAAAVAGIVVVKYKT